MDYKVKKTIVNFAIVATISAVNVKISADVASGNDSILHRTLSRSLVGTNNEEYQEYLEARRRYTPNQFGQNKIDLIKILSFPNDVNYDDYKQK